MPDSDNVDRERAKEEVRKVLASLPEVVPEAEAEEAAVKTGRLDPDLQSVLIKIENLQGQINLRATQKDLDKLKMLIMRATIGVAVGFIIILLNLIGRLIATSLGITLPDIVG